jgi:putative transposase
VVEHLAHVRSRLGFQLFAYVVMPDHIHLLLHPIVEVAIVRRILSALKTRTAAIVLERLRREEPSLAARASDVRGSQHLWQPWGGYDRNIWSRDEFLEKARYIEENPVRRRLAERPEDYAWSSAGSELLGRDPW